MTTRNNGTTNGHSDDDKDHDVGDDADDDDDDDVGDHAADDGDNDDGG